MKVRARASSSISALRVEAQGSDEMNTQLDRMRSQCLACKMRTDTNGERGAPLFSSKAIPLHRHGRVLYHIRTIGVAHTKVVLSACQTAVGCNVEKSHDNALVAGRGCIMLIPHLTVSVVCEYSRRMAEIAVLGRGQESALSNGNVIDMIT